MSGDRGSGRSRRRRNRPIGQAIRSASPELRPTATARIDAAQSGRLSMVSSPVTLTGGHLAHDLITGLLTTAGVRLYRGSGLIASWSRAAFNGGRAIGSFFPTMVGFAAPTLMLGPAIALFCVLACALMIVMLLTLPETHGRAIADLEPGVTGAPSG